MEQAPLTEARFAHLLTEGTPEWRLVDGHGKQSVTLRELADTLLVGHSLDGWGAARLRDLLADHFPERPWQMNRDVRRRGASLGAGITRARLVQYTPAVQREREKQRELCAWEARKYLELRHVTVKRREEDYTRERRAKRDEIFDALEERWDHIEYIGDGEKEPEGLSPAFQRYLSSYATWRGVKWEWAALCWRDGDELMVLPCLHNGEWALVLDPDQAWDRLPRPEDEEELLLAVQAYLRDAWQPRARAVCRWTRRAGEAGTPSTSGAIVALDLWDLDQCWPDVS